MTGVADEVIANPVGVVVRLVGEIERRLDATRIREIVCEVVRARAGRRSLAQALWDDPSLLRTGRSPAPYCVAKLGGQPTEPAYKRRHSDSFNVRRCH